MTAASYVHDEIEQDRRWKELLRELRVSDNELEYYVSLGIRKIKAPMAQRRSLAVNLMAVRALYRIAQAIFQVAGEIRNSQSSSRDHAIDRIATALEDQS